MKIRQGFVSNSSSSSFCIYGSAFSTEQWEVLITRHMSAEDLEAWKLEDHDWWLDEYAEEQMSKKSLNLIMVEPPDSSMVYVGRSWSNIGNDETGLEFKANVIDSIVELLEPPPGTNLVFDTHSEAWYDG